MVSGPPPALAPGRGSLGSQSLLRLKDCFLGFLTGKQEQSLWSLPGSFSPWGLRLEEVVGWARALEGPVIRLQSAAHCRKDVGERVECVETSACSSEPVMTQLPLGRNREPHSLAAASG